MSILFLLIPLGLVLLGIAVWGFIWAVDHDQFDDLDRAAYSILLDEERGPDGELIPPASEEPEKDARPQGDRSP